jgi:DNA recombination protein RmuC
MEAVMIGILSGIVAAAAAGLILYQVLSRVLETKLHRYTEALLQFQQQAGSSQTRQMEGLRGQLEYLNQGMGSLEKSLTNVKTRGIYGEWQLGSILREVLRPEQYETECRVVPGSQSRVEFAVKMPGAAGKTVYLPIDSKFPLDAYLQLQEAREEKDVELEKDAVDLFKSRIKRFAKEVHDKYICPPFTTDFAILFFPFESVYAEVLQMGVLEELMMKYRITVAGPSSLAAILNGLQVGFRTIALTERTGEMWNALSDAGGELDRFEQTLSAVQKRLDQTSAELEQLVGVRTRKLRKKLEVFEEELE